MRQHRRYLPLLGIPFAVLILVLFLRASSNDPTNLSIERAGAFVELQSSTGDDAILPLASEGEGAGLMSEEQAVRLATLPTYDASAVLQSPTIQFTSNDWETTGLTIPDATWLLLSVSISQPTPYELVRRVDLMETQVDQGLLLIVDGDYECRVGSPETHLSVACDSTTPHVIVSLVPGK